MEKKNKKNNILILLAVFFWACAFPAIHILLDELSFVNLTILRFAIVSLILIPVVLF
ncbi:MAG: EamA family transporter [Candidatus Thermoplasmatota archaeon]